MKMDHVEKMLLKDIEYQEAMIKSCDNEVYYIQTQLHISEEFKDDLVKKWEGKKKDHQQRKDQCLMALDLVKRYQYEDVFKG